MVYIAVIGDIKNSKELETRAEVQKKMQGLLDELNEEYSSEIASKLTITLGDEFQGLFYRGEMIYDVIKRIKRTMYPVEIRFGIGIGEIVTDINPDLAIGADGPAYYYAREAIEIAHAFEKRNKSFPSDVVLRVGEEGDKITLMNNTFMLIHLIETNWTKRQREIVLAIEEWGDNQQECAKRLGIGQSTVQRTLISANYYAYRDSCNVIKTIFKDII